MHASFFPYTTLFRSNSESSLSFESYLKKLKQVQEYQADGGTIYRQKTARLSLEVASAVKKVHPFLDPIECLRLVSAILPDYAINNMGIPPKTIADRLGNTVEMIYNVYSHSFKELEDKAVVAVAFSESLASGAKIGAN